MFGINDTNQNTNTQTPLSQPVGSSPGLTPSPFMDSASESPAAAPSAPLSSGSAPALPPEPTAPLSPLQNADALVSIKEQALTSLSPLVGHLDQTPEEKFKTTMMLIQASDNSTLIKEAYEAANQISDEKTRAQALLDVVNEINYFTQKENKN
jgi:hypothetical protein